MTTYEFYRDSYGGVADEASFTSVISFAEGIIRGILYPATEDELSEVQSSAFDRAVCLQVDGILADRNRTGNVRVKRESLGDRSVTYELDGTHDGVRIKGVDVSPEAILLLEGCGCLSRWV